MKYDSDDVRRIIEDKRNRFKRLIAAMCLLIAVSIFLMVFYSETTLDFISVVLIIISASVIFRLISVYKPTILFSDGLSGVNIKEHEYVTAGTRITRYGGISYRYIPSRHKGDVFLKLDDGNVVMISNLNKAHLDLYEIGDRLLVYEGTKYPVIEGRPVKKQPCPICGTINDDSRECCTQCGLKTLK